METPLARFWRQTRTGGVSSCIEWTGAKDADGYGQFMVDGRNYKAHRWIVGNPDAVVRHSCNNPGCVRKSHLVIGTQQENIEDQLRAGTHSKLKYSDEVIAQIRADYSAGRGTQRALADKYGVSKTHVGVIVKGLTRTIRRV